MLRKILIGGLLGGLVFFVWLGVSWSMPFLHLGQLKGLEADPQTDAWLADLEVDHSKLYYYPAMLPGESEPEYSARLIDSRVIGLLNVIPPGEYRIGVMVFIRGLAGALIAGLLLAWLLSPAIHRSYWQRVSLCSAFGLASFCAEPFLTGNFMFLPRGHVFFQFVDSLVGWSLAGLVIAAFVKADAGSTVAPATASIKPGENHAS
ncbi:hypothetical protein IT575_02345 [bacterium]|nr:hypothetical protein [bacterium]